MTTSSSLFELLLSQISEPYEYNHTIAEILDNLEYDIATIEAILEYLGSLDLSVRLDEIDARLDGVESDVATLQAMYDYITIEVPASSTVDLYSIPMADFSRIDFQIEMLNTSEDKFKSLSLHASKVTSTTVEDSISGILGSRLNLALNFDVVSSDAVLEAVNQETFPITVKLRTVFTFRDGGST